MNKILICGLNGSGKSTIGKELSNILKYEYRDAEDYYFDKNNDYSTPRSKDEVCQLLYNDMMNYHNFIFSSVKGNYGSNVESLFTCAIYIHVDKETRMKRIRKRSYLQFGDRMLEGGDLFEKEENFFNFVSNRDDDEVINWLNSLNIPIIQIDGTLPINQITKELYNKIIN